MHLKSFKIKLISKLFLSLIFLFVLFFTNNALAASINLSPSTGSFKVGDIIKVRVVLSSGDQSANAVSGTISYSKEFLTLNSISKVGSVVGLWAVEPSYSNLSGVANMEGVILNGYLGSNGTIVTLSFKAKAIGNASIKLNNSSVLANDGQGTNILSSMGQANFEIVKADVKSTPTATVENSKIVPSIQIQEIKDDPSLNLTKKFLITSVGKKAESVYKVEIDDVSYSWTNQESNIFQTPVLLKGSHNLKVFMNASDESIVSNKLSFSIKSIMTPTINEYLENVKDKEYIVLKGIADPNANIVINYIILSNDDIVSNKVINWDENKDVKETTIKSDDKGIFTYVSEKVSSGTYEIVVHAIVGNIESGKSIPIRVKVISESIPITTSIMNTFSAVIPVIALIILLVILAIWGWYKVLHYKESMHKKLIRTKTLIAKSFDILDEDVTEEIKIFKKIKASEPLTNEERLFINQIKKDLESAEKVITDNIK